MKGPVSELNLKISAFTAHLSLKVQDFSKVPMGFSMQRTLKDAGLHQKLVLILPCIVFTKQNLQKIGTGSYLVVYSVL